MDTLHHPLARVASEAERNPVYAGERHRIGWAGIALRALAALVVGLCTLVLPEISIAVLLSLLAGYTLVSAGAALSAARELLRRGEPAWPVFVYGIAAAAVAVALLWWPPAATPTLLVVLALWLAIGGTTELVLMAQLRRVMPHAQLLGAVGAVSVVAAGVLLAQARWVTGTAARVIGIYALLSGLFLSGFAARLRHEQRALRTRVE